MTAMNHLYAQEHWKHDTEFSHIEVANTGQVRNAETGAPLPVHGSGGKAFVKIVDRHGRRHDRNVRRLVRKLFGIAPMRITPQTASAPQPPQPPTIEQETAVVEQTQEPAVAQDTDWVAVRWPGVREGYRISRDGQMISPSGEIITGSVQKSPFGNYVIMNLLRVPNERYSGNYIKVRLDDMVTEHFVGPRPDDNHTPKHLNGDTMDSRAENLEWTRRVRRRINRSPLAGPRRKPQPRRSRARSLNADPDWRLVTNPKIGGQYWISRDAQIQGVTGTLLTQKPHTDGRLYVNVQSQRGGNTTMPVDRLVLEAFTGLRPTPSHRPRYRNGDKGDCSLDNLYWGTTDQAPPVGPVVADPEPTPVITPTRAQVTVTTLASYRIGEVEVIVNNGIIEPPKGGTAVQQAAALAQIYAEIAKQGETNG